MRVGRGIADRLLALAVAVVRLSRELPKDAAARHVGLQLVRSATAGGANYEEARAAESRDDFVHKVSVAAKEMREAHFWLSLVHRSGWSRADLASALVETQELAAILGASARTARARGADST